VEAFGGERVEAAAEGDRGANRRGVEGLRDDPFPVGALKLAGAEHTYRIREGSHRVIYSVVASRLVVEVIRVGHRKDVYRK
jgi:mRNA interferase RelE/StbE